MIETFHKPEDVAPRVGMSLGAFYAACRAKQFPHVRIGRRIRVPESALIRWMEDQVARNMGERITNSNGNEDEIAK